MGFVETACEESAQSPRQRQLQFVRRDEVATFRGNQTARIDDKGRLKLPSVFKDLLDSEAVTRFFITTTDLNRAEIWPLKEWEKVEEALDNNASVFNEAVERFSDRVNFYGREVDIDAQGRVLLPQQLRTLLEFGYEEVTVMGKRKFLAVHHVEQMEQRVGPDAFTAEMKSQIDAILSAGLKGQA